MSTSKVSEAGRVEIHQYIDAMIQAMKSMENNEKKLKGGEETR